MDITAKLMQQAARKPGIGEVHICYFDTSPPTYHARAMPTMDAATTATVAEFEGKGVASVSPPEFGAAVAKRMQEQVHHGKGRTPEEALRALLVDMANREPLNAIKAAGGKLA